MRVVALRTPCCSKPLKLLNFMNWLAKQGRQLPEADALALLRSSSRSALWRYLLYLVSQPERADDAELHTELAIVLVDEALELLGSAEGAATKHGASRVLDRKSSLASGIDTTAHETGSAAHVDAADACTASTRLVSDTAETVDTDAGEMALVRRQLQKHLAASNSCEVAVLLARLAGTRLWKERIIVHAKARHRLPSPVSMS